MSASFSLCASTQIKAPSHTINLFRDFNPTRSFEISTQPEEKPRKIRASPQLLLLGVIASLRSYRPYGLGVTGLSALRSYRFAPTIVLHVFVFVDVINCKRFSLFFLDEKETPERVNSFSLRLSGCLHTSRIKLRALMTLTRVLSQQGVFFVFFLNQKQWLEVSVINRKL